MKFFDKRGRLFGIVSLIDVAVIVVVALLSVGIYMRYFKLDNTAVAQDSTPITYKLVVQGVRQYTVDAFRVNDTLFDETGSESLGTITDISVEDATEWSKLLDGTYVKAPVEDRYDVTLTVSADGVVTNGRYYVSRTTEMGVNMNDVFATKYCIVSGTVLEIG